MFPTILFALSPVVTLLWILPLTSTYVISDIKPDVILYTSLIEYNLINISTKMLTYKCKYKSTQFPLLTDYSFVWKLGTLHYKYYSFV